MASKKFAMDFKDLERMAKVGYGFQKMEDFGQICNGKLDELHNWIWSVQQLEGCD